MSKEARPRGVIELVVLYIVIVHSRIFGSWSVSLLVCWVVVLVGSVARRMCNKNEHYDQRQYQSNSIVIV
jgi:hypothetical protein